MHKGVVCWERSEHANGGWWMVAFVVRCLLMLG